MAGFYHGALTHQIPMGVYSRGNRDGVGPRAPAEEDAMSMCWVQAGICGEETSIEASKTGPSEIALSFTTTCEHITALAEDLRAVEPAWSCPAR